jgi:hypothetical protein
MTVLSWAFRLNLVPYLSEPVQMLAQAVLGQAFAINEIEVHWVLRNHD